MNTIIKNHINHIKNNFLSYRQEIETIPLVKLGLGGDFKELTTVR